MRLLVFAAVLAAAPAAAAQQVPASGQDSTGIHTTLRAFYFNLAHRDWEAIAADVLSAKVVAHRPSPVFPPLAVAASCAQRSGALVDAAVIRREGDWAEVSVPRCDAEGSGADEFRLIRFEQRWRFVAIQLHQETGISLLIR